MKLPIDKQAHFLAGYAISATALMLLPYGYGLALAVIAGSIKELYDYASGKGTADRWDAIATGIGGLVGEIVFQVIKWIQHII